MPKRASDYEKEICYTSKTWQKQHKDPNCRSLKNKEVIETNRRQAYLKGARLICCFCWYNTPEVKEENPTSIIEFVAKPVTVKAIQWTGDNLEEIRSFCNNMAFMENDHLYVETLEGTSRARLNDWVVQGTMGEFYPIKPAVMEAKYNKKEK